jgi:hypothetical protein
MLRHTQHTGAPARGIGARAVESLLQEPQTDA